MSQTQMEQAESINSQEVQEPEKGRQSRRPPNTAFRQQRLKAWQPILTPKTVLPLFFAVGIIFAPIGGLLLYASAKVQEIAIEYQDCTSAAPLYPAAFSAIPSNHITSYFKNDTPTADAPTWQRSTTVHSFGPGADVTTNVCSLQFYIPDDLPAPILLYYRLTNFYQNHRRYVKSFDQDQLDGKFESNDTISNSNCDPLKLDPATGKAYYPCGLIANSQFNDTFHSPVALNSAGANADNVTYVMTNQGISWDTDKDLYNPTAYTVDDVVPPPNWRLRYPNGYNAQFPLPDLHNMPEFQVWMRTAGLPSFSKLALRNDSTAMASGRYQIDIYDYFNVTEFSGTKSILISTRTIMGGRNPFLGIAYIVVAGICVVLGALFTATHLIKPRKLGDHTYLSWNNDQAANANATTTGRASRPGDSA